MSETNVKRLATVAQIPGLYPAMSVGTMRWLIFNENRNGFSECVRRIGRKILIDLDSFEHWIEKQGGAK